MADWILTYSGRKFYPTAPRAEDVSVRDVAHALSMLCRFTGHCHRFYSVAEHSVLVSQLVPAQHALWALLHDAAEAYVNDLARPLKHDPLLAGYREAEDRVLRAIADRFDLTWPMPEAVHEVDVKLSSNERADLFPGQEEVRGRGLPNLGRVRGLAPAEAEAEFLKRFKQLWWDRVREAEGL